MQNNTGHSALVLSGGGSRGAYQAGVSRALFEICKASRNLEAFQIITGVSAGAINASFLASHSHNLDAGTQKLVDLWSNIHTEQIFKVDPFTLSGTGLRLARGVSLGGISQAFGAGAVGLLNTEPLRDLIEKNVDFEAIHKNIQANVIRSLAITATDYSTSTRVSFIESNHPFSLWQRAHRLSRQALIDSAHVLGSSAIPLFFTPVKIHGRYYGDGCLRNVAPLSPAIHLGADRLFVIGVRTPDNTPFEQARLIKPSLGRVLSVVINAIFMDAIEADLERLNLLNQSLHDLPQSHFRKIDSLYVSPSKDLAAIAKDKARQLPRVLKFLIRGLGNIEESAEIISYLTFESDYCSTLVELGYEDCLRLKPEVENFLSH